MKIGIAEEYVVQNLYNVFPQIPCSALCIRKFVTMVKKQSLWKTL